MSWPTLQDYNEAVQNPRTAFADPELRQGKPELNTLGLPKPVSGQFATVYRLHCDQKRYAVRCFAKEIPDIHERYAAISERLHEVKLRQVVQFNYLANGIQIGPKWYPIIKMEWVQGELLPKYIERNLTNPKALLELAREFVELFQSLQAASIAHGDLQHGNVLVVGGQLRLIDYDGMFVPKLRGRQSNETGHRNYQHPSRTAFDFGPGMDMFSAWVIYVSLVVLSNNPNLWKQFAGGDECLLFRREDFEKPEESRLLSAIEGSSDPAVAGLGSLFKSLLYLSPSQVPPLDGKPTIIQLGVGGPSSTAAVVTGASAWWKDHRPEQAPVSARGASTEKSRVGDVTFDSAWVLDFIEQPAAQARSPSWGVSARRERISLILTVLLAALLLSAGRAVLALDFLVSVVLAGIGLNAIWWRIRFERLAVVGERRTVEAERREAEGRQKVALRAFKQAEEALNAARRTRTDAENRAISERRAIDQRERTERGKAEREWQSRLSTLRNQRAAITKQEADALQRVASSLGWQRAGLLREIQALDSACQTELGNRLGAIQREHVYNHLASWNIDHARVPGISPALKRALRASGIATAADISWGRVSSVRGFGNVRTSAMTTWKQELEDMARRDMPTTLPAREEQAITTKHSAKKAALEAEAARLDQQIRSEEARVRDYHRAQAAPIDQAINAAQQALVQEMDAIRNKFALERRTLEEAILRGIKAATEQVQQKNVEIQERRTKLLPMQWESAKLQRRLRLYDTITFGNFARYILSFSGGLH